MAEVKKYFIQETQWCMLGLEHPKPAEFYLSVWQTNRSPVILLIFRAVLFLGSLGIMLSSLILYGLHGIFGYWFIYLTHWGLLTIVLATGFGTAVSARSYIYGPIGADLCLPWYVKTFWVLYNIANPLAYLITIFYWTVLYRSGVEEEFNPGLDVAVHVLNTVVMLMLLATSTHPSRLLHVFHPVVFGLTYVAFGVIFYLAGGTNSTGDRWVYFVINWAQPGKTFGWIVLTTLLLLCMHLLTVGLAAARDAIANRWVKTSDVVASPEEATALRQTQITN